MSGSRKRILIGASVLAVLVLGVGLYLFQPWRLVTNRQVDDALVAPPVAAAPSAPSTPDVPDAPAAPAGPVVVGGGDFRSLDHGTTGQAQLVRLPDGRHVVQFANLDTSDGPDLRVWLSPKPSTSAEQDFKQGYLELGFLKGNKGNQVYEIPPTAAVDDYRSVIIWCKRFSSGFGVAPLSG
jgi:hypothetical protein